MDDYRRWIPTDVYSAGAIGILTGDDLYEGFFSAEAYALKRVFSYKQ